MRYELTIDASYVSRWGLAEGVRELLQNGRDAEVVDGHKLTVTHVGNTLRIESAGAVLGRDTLLLGRTSKTGRAGAAGQWGEGYKLALLCLLRAGYGVKLRTGDEVWTPSIEASERFDGARVLVVDVATGREPRQRVRVEVAGISAEQWADLRGNYLFLGKSGQTVPGDHGALLLDEARKGSVYVKGIFVTSDPDLRYGYDLAEAELDRDRRLIDPWDLAQAIRRVWIDAVRSRPDLIDQFSTLLDNRASDLKGISDWNLSELPTAVVDSVAATFVARFGDQAVPVANLGESQALEHLGARGIVVAPVLATVLAAKLGTPDAIKARMQTEVLRLHSWSDLTSEEQTSLTRAIDLCALAEPVSLADVDIADFRSSTLLGQYKDKRILLSKRILASRRETLATLIHEVAHRRGGDGEKGHVAALESIWASLSDLL